MLGSQKDWMGPKQMEMLATHLRLELLAQAVLEQITFVSGFDLEEGFATDFELAQRNRV